MGVRTRTAGDPLDDGPIAAKVFADIVDTYQRNGFGPAMARFIALVMHQACCRTATWSIPHPIPHSSGFPARTTGTRDDLLLSGNLAMPPDCSASTR